MLGHHGYPVALADDHDPPRVLFHRGDLDALDGTRASIVGTRRCTRYGHDISLEFGRELARAGVRVVSGLALGIDGAAHRGALDASDDGGAPPIGVVGKVLPPEPTICAGPIAAFAALLLEPVLIYNS